MRCFKEKYPYATYTHNCVLNYSLQVASFCLGSLNPFLASLPTGTGTSPAWVLHVAQDKSRNQLWVDWAK